MKCAFQEVSRGPRGSCKGDSGGPLLSYQTNGGFYVQTGVVQGSDGCGDANFPTIFARIQDPEIFSFIKKVGTVMLAQDIPICIYTKSLLQIPFTPTTTTQGM